MDAVAIKKSWVHPLVTVYEVKVSRNDFLRDDKWPQYLAYCNRFYFACPSGLIEEKDIDDPRVGLIWVNDKGNCITKKSIPSRAVDIPAEFYQYILFSRIDSERIPFYSDKEEYIRGYINHEVSARTLARQFSSAMIKQLAELETNFEDKENVEGKLKAYEELIAVIRNNGFYFGSANEFGEVLAVVKKVKDKELRIHRLTESARELIRLADETR
jgi:hypothetical protein